MGLKFLLLVVVVVVIAVLLGLRRPRSPSSRSAGTKSSRDPGNAPVAPMRVCSHCGVHLPLSEALLDSADRAYCSETHRLAGPR